MEKREPIQKIVERIGQKKTLTELYRELGIKEVKI